MSVITRRHINTDNIELIFNALIYIFKYLCRSIIQNIIIIINNTLLPLLHHDKWYIRRFIAESFAYVIRQINHTQIEQVIHILLASESMINSRPKKNNDTTDNNYKDGISATLFYLHKSVQFSLHSITETTLSLILTQMFC